MTASGKTVVVRLERVQEGDLGMHVDALTLAVCLVEPHGLVAEWNKFQPTCAIEPGDRIVSVNGLWYPELVMEELSASSSLRMVVEKKGGLAGALAPHSKFTVQLCASECGNFGLEVNFDIMEVVNVIEDGLVAWWNVNHPFRAIVVGDRIVEINGEVQPAGMQEALLASEVDLVMMRNTKSKTGLATHGTFGVRLVGSAQLGFGVSVATCEVEKMEAGSVQSWNAANPINKLRLGDRLIQVNGKCSPKSIQAELKTQKDLRLVVARAERRVDQQSRSLLTLKECQATWPKETDRWQKMVRMAGTPGSQAASTLLAAKRHIFLELQRVQAEGWGFNVSPETLRINGVEDGGLLAVWNYHHPSCAAVQGDQVVEINGVAQSKGVMQMLKQSLSIKVEVMRHGSMTSTFGIRLVKTAEQKLGLKLSEAVEVIKIDPSGALASWNASHPLLAVHLGDRILQVGQTVAPEQIFRSLQSDSVLEFVLGRVPRRWDATTQMVLSFQECQAIYGKEAEKRWRDMKSLPDAPEQHRDITKERQFLEGAEGDQRQLLASESFYRTLADTHPTAVAPPAPQLALPAAVAETRSTFSCPCCHRLFHVFMEDGLYHALPATGALGAMQLKASETWNPKATGSLNSTTVDL